VDPVASRGFALRRDGAVAADRDPEHGHAVEGLSQCCWEVALPRKTSSTMILAPARAIAAMPSIHAASTARKSAPTVTSPSAAKAMSVPAPGIASTRVSVPNVSHGPGRIA
jgi:hypothetical protein